MTVEFYEIRHKDGGTCFTRPEPEWLGVKPPRGVDVVRTHRVEIEPGGSDQ